MRVKVEGGKRGAVGPTDASRCTTPGQTTVRIVLCHSTTVRIVLCHMTTVRIVLCHRTTVRTVLCHSRSITPAASHQQHCTSWNLTRSSIPRQTRQGQQGAALQEQELASKWHPCTHVHRRVRSTCPTSHPADSWQAPRWCTQLSKAQRASEPVTRDRSTQVDCACYKPNNKLQAFLMPRISHAFNSGNLKGSCGTSCSPFCFC